jgi:hypothetical protein
VDCTANSWKVVGGGDVAQWVCIIMLYTIKINIFVYLLPNQLWIVCETLWLFNPTHVTKINKIGDSFGHVIWPQVAKHLVHLFGPRQPFLNTSCFGRVWPPLELSFNHHDFTKVQTRFHQGSKLVHKPSNQRYRSVLSTNFVNLLN